MKHIMDDYNYFSTVEFEEAYLYDGNDLGANWQEEKTLFRVWAPTATQVMLNLYKTGNGNDMIKCIAMKQDVKGTWIAEEEGDVSGIYYTYSVTVYGETREAVDPYAKAVGVNGDRGMVINLASTDPVGFREEEIPEFENSTDAIIYELHIRDFSVDSSSGMKHKGKYLAFTEESTVNSYGDFTGIEHLKELGVTHIHLLPTFDYATVDETKLQDDQFNWGYDPKNYNVPDGSYASDPYLGDVRIKEFKRMIQALHKKGLRVIMDVVYNHTAASYDSNFHCIVPGYYYRMTPEGYFSNASACGNETASERFMMRKFMTDSILYWINEYHVDGFRFDLMGIHDIKTMNSIREAIDRIDPSILMYGEGWTGGLSPLPDWEKALKVNIGNMDPGIAAFSDELRDGIKGSVFSARERGFINGKEGMEETIKFGVVASTRHPQIDYWRVNYSKAPWAAEPTQTISYASAHDNLTLWDKLIISNSEASQEDRIKMNLLSAAIIMTSQGTPFFQAGEEFLRSKPVDESGTRFDENSYRSPDYVNSLKWDTKAQHKEVFEYYKGLIALRKKYKAFRMTKTIDIQENLYFLEVNHPNVVGFIINQGQEDDLCVIYNANPYEVFVQIPEGQWNVYVQGMKAGTEILATLSGDWVKVEAISTLMSKKEKLK